MSWEIRDEKYNLRQMQKQRIPLEILFTKKYYLRKLSNANKSDIEAREINK